MNKTRWIVAAVLAAVVVAIASVVIWINVSIAHDREDARREQRHQCILRAFEYTPGGSVERQLALNSCYLNYPEK